MRISDWSSDVCSSDLHKLKARNQHWRRRHSDQDERHSTQDKNCGQIQKAFNQHGANQHADGDSELTMEPDHTKAIPRPQWKNVARSEEHTSELQSLMRISYAVLCLKKKKIITY